MMRKYFFRGILGSVLLFLLTACATEGSQVPNANKGDLNILPFASHSNIWTTMSQHYELANDADSSEIQKGVDWFLTRPKTTQLLLSNASPYVYYIYEQTQAQGLPAELALLPMIESAYDPFVFSRTGATGLWQLMPGTGSGFGLTIDWWYDGRRDVVESTHVALRYLTYLHRLFGDWLLAIAAYNAGEGTVTAAIEHNKRLHQPTDYWHLALPPETKFYVPKLLGLAEVIKHHRAFDVPLPNTPNRPYFEAVPMNTQIDLKQVSQLAGVEMDTVRTLNPGFRRWATLPNTSYHLLLPLNTVEKFKNELALLPKSQRVTMQHHQVKSGETLLAVARRYHTDVNTLKQVNNVNTNIIHVNQSLMVPQDFHGDLAASMALTSSKIAAEKLPGPQHYLHVVKKNESLRSIARQYGLNPRQIQFWNGMGRGEEVKPTEELVLWLPSHAHHHIAKLHYAAQHTSGRMHMHYVNMGETLSLIARQYHVSVSTLAQWNHLSTHALLKPGQRLIIY
ncbi:MAG TPA: LysM peptidoglycan-binding domain-containing protein [Coxiellaceae bacterium]|nr:LysM peptidoglycan-binding domain-containing protein [Coxiellaceae bacterium]